MKKCVGCGEYKDLSAYAPNGKTRKGTQKYRSRCRDCESKRQYRIRSVKTNKDRYTTDRLKGYRVKHSFGITYEDWVNLMESSEWKCEICGRTIETSGRTLAVDHCHKTGRIRGVLCQRCNCAIGLMNDDPAILQNAIQYLHKEDTK